MSCLDRSLEVHPPSLVGARRALSDVLRLGPSRRAGVAAGGVCQWSQLAAFGGTPLTDGRGHQKERGASAPGAEGGYLMKPWAAHASCKTPCVNKGAGRRSGFERMLVS